MDSELFKSDSSDPPLLIAPSVVESKTIGRCIYCTSTTELSDEHVVPYFLGGALILKKASCEDCRRITSQFETRLSKTLFSLYRRKANIQSRSKSETHLRIFNLDSGYEVPYKKVEDLPAAVIMLVLPPPQIVMGLPPQDEEPKLRFRCLNMNGKVQATKVKSARIEMEFYSYDMLRLIAKIAHGYMVSTFELSHFEPLLTDVIRFGNFAPYFAGGGTVAQSKNSSDQPPAPPDNLINAIEFREGVVRGDTKHLYLFAHIQPASIAGPIIYTAVVGRRVAPGAVIKRDQRELVMPVGPATPRQNLKLMLKFIITESPSALTGNLNREVE